jgi:arabinoxylan arabinofuranohydrolase
MPFSRRHFLTRAGAMSVAMTPLPDWPKLFRIEKSLADQPGLLPTGGNPIVVGRGLCDPQVRIYEDQAYLYATHDASPGSDRFIMNNWWIWQSSDLVHWQLVSILRPEDTYWGKPWNQCWATDAMTRNGRYYFYFSRGPEEIGVVQGDSPIGPWTDPLRKPLIAKGSTPTKARDPGILQEKDGTSYIVFGCWDYYIARLNEDMTSLAETPRIIVIDKKMGPYGPGKTDDKPFLHKREGFYYLSWGCYYAMSDNVYGPYVYRDTIIKAEDTDPPLQKQKQGLTSDRHGSFFELHNQWYFACNDKAWPGTDDHYRDSVMSYVHYRDNGEIAPIDLRLIGVGQYDAETRIQAADYFSAVGAEIAECANGGFEVRGVRNGATLHYPNLRNLPKHPTISFQVACGNPAGCHLDIWNSSQHERQLGRAAIPCTGSWESYRNIRCRLNISSSTANLRLVVQGKGDELLRLRWFEVA